MFELSIGYPGSLHNHTEYSNLRLRDAIVRPKELIDYAIELGHSVVAFTEHETISNAIKIENYVGKSYEDVEKMLEETMHEFKLMLNYQI